MGDICLNALPLVVKAEPATVVGRKWKRDDSFDADLHDRPERGTNFHHYSLDAWSYVWPLLAGALPDDCASRGSELFLEDVPATVVAFAARQAAVQMLMSEGFSLCSVRLGKPTRLSRRNKNLAEGIVGHKLPKDVGAFAALSVQGMPARRGRPPAGRRCAHRRPMGRARTRPDATDARGHRD